jgi:hypothetical protein
MLLGHIAVGLAGRRLTPGVSLGAWMLAVMFVDLLWPIFLLTGIEHVRIAPGITAFTPLDFYDYPITHSLVGGVAWAVVVAGAWKAGGTATRAALLLGLGVLSHWVLDAVVHRPDLPVLPEGPYVGLGLWHSVPGTMAVELSLFGAGLAFYLRGGGRGGRRISFWLFIAFLLVAYLGAALGPPPPGVTTLAISALTLWILVPVAWWADRPTPASLSSRPS